MRDILREFAWFDDFLGPGLGVLPVGDIVNSATVLGPAANFELTNVDAQITGMSVTLACVAGRLFIEFRANISSALGAASNAFLHCWLDGVEIDAVYPRYRTVPGEANTLAGHYLVTVASGDRTVTLRGSGDFAVGDIILANSARLSVLNWAQ